jgi:hypothetical protein
MLETRPTPHAPNRPSARVRLSAILAREPNACLKYSLSDLARLLQVSRQRVHQLLPDYVRRRPDVVARSLAGLLERRPEAILTKDRGGLTLPEIAQVIGCRTDELRVAWRSLDLPDRRLMKLTMHERYERRKDMRRRSAQAWRARIYERYNETIVEERPCAICGSLFPWTRWDELTRRRTPTRTCSWDCTRRLIGRSLRGATTAR